MSHFPFCGSSYTLQSPILSGEELINAYLERPDVEGALSPVAIMHCPGLKVAYTLAGENSVPSQFTVNGRTFAAGSKFWELLGNGTGNPIGALNGPPLTPTQIFSCQTHLLILSNGSLYVYVLSQFTDASGTVRNPGAFFAVDMSQFNFGGQVLQIDFCDGYFFAVLANSNSFQVSNLEDGTTWSGLYVSTINRFPDNITSMKVDHDFVWFFSGKKTIAYYNVGAGYPPFIPYPGAFLEDGAVATFGTVLANDTICWIEQNDRGPGIAKMMGSFVGIRLSTLAVEFAWSKYPTLADAISYAYQDQGHNFWQITFPSANVTWLYDFTSKEWTKRGFWNAGTGMYTKHRSVSHTYNFGKHLVGDPQSGNIYQQSVDVYTDFGNPIRGMRRTSTISNENKWIYFPYIEFMPEVGLGPMPPLLDGNGQPRGPQLMLRWSDNGGKTYGNTYYLDCGQAGEYNKRVRKNQLGRSRKRVWEVTWTDPVPFRINDAYLRAISEGRPLYEAA